MPFLNHLIKWAPLVRFSLAGVGKRIEKAEKTHKSAEGLKCRFLYSLLCMH